VRDFWVREGRQEDFEGTFGAQGIWTDFLKRSRQYLGSVLWLESATERCYRLVDSWMSHVGFEAFRAIHQLDCNKFDQFVARRELIAREEFLGAFYRNDPESEEGDELVPS
jgi:hypothetical protein